MPGVFDIRIDNGYVYKTLNKRNKTAIQISSELKNENKLKEYIAQLNSYKLPIIGKFIKPPSNTHNNGNYDMKYVEGINLMDILKENNEKCKKAGWNSKEVKLEKYIGMDILNKLFILESSLYEYSKSFSLRGDWFLHNLIYDLNDKEIYNIDLEGFYTYYGDSPMCDLKFHIPSQLAACKSEILNQLSSNIFTIILWNPVHKYQTEIVSNVEEEFTVLLNQSHSITCMKTFVDKVYELDVRCHKPYLPRKIDILKKYTQEIQFLVVLIDNPNYDQQNVSKTAVDFKEKIRSRYKQKIENYYKDIIIHVSDNSLEAENIYRIIL